MKISLALLLLFVSQAGTLFAANIANPSFEANATSFTVFPGYISGNTPITDWTHTTASQQGLNGGIPAGSPFANQGLIPEGSAASFIQTNGNTNTLTGSISDLVAGQDYTLSVYTNSRNGYAVPTASVSVAGSTINFTQPSESRFVPRTLGFTATSSTENIVISSSTATDGALVFDNLNVAAGLWGESAWVDDASLALGAVTHAYNFGSATSATIGATTFTGISGGSPSSAGTATNGGFSLAGPGGVISNDPNNLSDPGSGILARQFVYGGSPATLTVNDLIPGSLYSLNLLSVGWEDGFRNMDITSNAGTASFNQDAFGNNNGTVLTVPYLATAASETFTLTPRGGGGTFHFYGFYNVAPEPSRAVLLMFGGIALLLRRQR